MSRKYIPILVKRFLNEKKLSLYLFLISSILSIIMLIMPVKSEYVMIKLVPISYVFFTIVFIKPNTIVGIGSISLVILYLFRMCIVPLISAYGGFYHDVNVGLYINNFNLACFMMIVECFIVFLSLRYFQQIYKQKLNSLKKSYKIKNNLITKRNNPILYSVLIIFGVLCLFLFVKYPELRGYFKFFFMSNELNYEYNINFKLLVADLGPIYYIAKNVFEIFRPLFFFFIMYKILNSSKIKHKTFYGILISVISLIIVSGEQIHSAFISIVCIYNVILNMKSRGRIVKLLLIISTIVFMGYGLYTFSSANNPQMLSRAIQDYFGGPVVMATGLGIKSNDSIKYLLNDIYNGNTLLVGLFGSKISTTDLMNTYVNTSAKGTFFSFLIQSKFFFGWLAPITIIFIVWFIIRIDFKTELFINEYYKMIYQYIAFSVSVFLIMYSFTMVINYIIYTISLYIMLILIDNKVRCKK